MKEEAPEEQEQLESVGAYASKKQAHERGLVVLSMKLPYWVYKKEDQYHLFVEKQNCKPVSIQLEKFENEHRYWPPKPIFVKSEPTHGVSILTYVFTLILFFTLQHYSDYDIETIGIINNHALIEKTEWWRTLTALTLHADLAHLTGNIVIGCLFAYFTIHAFGYGIAWFLIVLSGALGNLATAIVYYPELHRAIGASIAVFGALGMLVGNASFHAAAARSLKRFKTVFVPVLGGFALLGLMGAGGIRTDIIGHLNGFLAGIALGLPATKIKTQFQIKDNLQTSLLIATPALLLLAWITAL